MSCKDLPVPDQERAGQVFRDLINHSKNILPLPGAGFKRSSSPSEPVDPVPDGDPWGGMQETDIMEALSHSSNATTLPAMFTELTVEDDSVLPDHVELEPEAHQLVPEEPDADSAVPEILDPHELSSALATLYLNYQDSIPQLASLPPSTAAESEDATTIYAMSKLQHKLTVDEGLVWDAIEELIASDADEDAFGSALQALEERSTHMSQSYDRRNNPPTAETYAECKLILEAMGVPCIEAAGPFEAEAVASTIVLNGYGDYVVSEDSVSTFATPCDTLY